MNRTKFMNELERVKGKGNEDRERTMQMIHETGDKMTEDIYPDDDSRAVLLIEELAELQQALTKSLRGKAEPEIGILEEIADVYICLSMYCRANPFVQENLYDALLVKDIRNREFYNHWMEVNKYLQDSNLA